MRQESNIVGREEQSAAPSARLAKILAYQELGINLDGNNPYIVFGVEPPSTVEDIKKLYRKIASIIHPDACVGLENERLFHNLTPSDAFHVISEAFIGINELLTNMSVGVNNVEVNNSTQERKEGIFKKVFGTGLIRHQIESITDAHRTELAEFVNLKGKIIDQRLLEASLSSQGHFDSHERARQERVITDLVVRQGISGLSMGAKYLAVDSFIGGTVIDEDQKRRAVHFLAIELNDDRTIQEAQIYTAVRLYLSRSCDRGTYSY